MSAPIREAARILRSVRQRRGVDELRRVCAKIRPTDLAVLARCWHLHARAKQLRPVDCAPWWVLQWGRGTGKTRTAAEDALDTMEDWGPKFAGVLASKTRGDLRRDMIQGVSGLIPCALRRGYELRFVPSERKIYHPNGATFDLISAEAPEGGRGGNWNYAWFDEVAAWGRDALTFFKVNVAALRHPAPTPDRRPRGVITTTPKANAIMRYILRDKRMIAKSTISRASTHENLANIVADDFIDLLQGTRLGKQEIDGEMLDDEGTLVSLDTIHAGRLVVPPDYMTRRIVSVDPAVTADDESDACGLIVLGADTRPKPHAYVLEDATLDVAHVTVWARRAVELAIAYDCEAIIVETNNGRDAILELLRVAMENISQELGREIVIRIVEVIARESKSARATPIGALYDARDEHQRHASRIHHIGVFPELEDELSTWIPGMDSPNRMDALVHGVTHLLLGDRKLPMYTW